EGGRVDIFQSVDTEKIYRTDCGRVHQRAVVPNNLQCRSLSSGGCGQLRETQIGCFRRNYKRALRAGRSLEFVNPVIRERNGDNVRLRLLEAEARQQSAS